MQMSIFLEHLINMTTDYNFRQVDNKYLTILDFVLFAVITSVSGVGTIESLDFTIDHNLKQLFWSAYGVTMSFAIRWLVVETIKKYKAYKRKKANGKKSD
jgi:hypothetical protein